MPIRMSGLVSNMDTENIVKELMSAQRMKSTKVTNKKTKLEWKQDKWKDLNNKIYSFYTEQLSKMKMQGSFGSVKTSSSDTSKIEVSSNGNTPEGEHSIEVKSVAKSQMITGAVVSANISNSTTLASLGVVTEAGSSITVTAGKETRTLSIDSDTTVQDFIDTLKDAGINASYDSTQKRFFVSSKKSGVENAFSITTSSASVDLSKLGLSQIIAVPQPDGTVGVSSRANVKVIAPSDANIVFDGVEINSASNTILVNGLSLTVKGVTDGANTADTTDNKPASIAVTRDVQASYDMIKKFVKSYNELLKGMNDAYYADTAKGYEPLTDEQKEAMSEEQEKNWEDKIKNSLLRRDNTIGTISSSMRMIFSKSVECQGKNYSLASFGITASDYTEKGLLHIDGNSEDTVSALKEDKLKKALTENPDAVMEVFTQLSEELYDDMTERMKSTKLRSAMTFYNDKEMKKEISNYKDEISTMEKKFTDMETRYYKQFTAMEKAMSNMNTQSSSILAMLGQSSK